MAEDSNSTIVHIEDLDLCKETLPLSDPNKVLSEITRNKVYYSSIDSDLIEFGRRPVYNTFVKAYANHYPITLSPDIIWLLIVQGFSRFVYFNAEELRHNFVNFEGKKEINIRCNMQSPKSGKKEQWEQVFSQICDEIAKDVGKDLVNDITPNFTTTTQTSLTACHISIMATFQKYFCGRISCCLCGIPYVILEGNLEDWQKVKEKCQVLGKYQLPWADKLDSIIDEFINAKEGKINKQFWQTMVRRKNGRGHYDPDHYTGWFTYLFPYDAGGNLYDGKITVDRWTATELLKFPLSLDVFGSGPTMTYKLNLLSGFVGVTQDSKTLSLKPEIGWIVEEAKAEDSGYS